MSSKAVITFTKKDDGFTTSTETRQIITELLTNRKQINFAQITPADARSLKELRFYRGVVLRLVGTYVQDMEQFADCDDSGKLTFDRLHRYLLLRFALDTNKGQYISLARTFYKGEWIDTPYVSHSFDKIRHE